MVLDEAYFDYVDRTDYSRSIEIVRGGRNLIVLRTFSKVYGLAGLRIGYGIGPAELLDEMNKIRGPFNTSSIAQAAALAAIDDREHVRRSIESNRAGLAQLSSGLKELGVKFVPSFTNFVLADFGFETEPLSDALLKRGVIVRPMRWMGFPNCIRVLGRRALGEREVSAGIGRGPRARRGESRHASEGKLMANAAPPQSDRVLEILKSSKMIAVVGLSSRHTRPSYGVAEYMQSAGYRIIPVNPNETEVLGERSYSRLEEIPERIDIVDVFRRPNTCPQSSSRPSESALAPSGCRKVWRTLPRPKRHGAPAYS